MSTDRINRNISKQLFLNISIPVLIIINILLGYLTYKAVSSRFNNSEQELRDEISEAKIKVEVLNGCGVSGIADKLTEYLRANKVDVVNLGNYRSFDVEHSIIISRNQKMKNAQNIAALIGLDENTIIQQINPDYLLDITFILGKDYRNLIPLNKR